MLLKVINARSRVRVLLLVRDVATRRRSRLLVQLVTYRLARWGVYVNPSAQVSVDVRLPHPTGIVIGAGVVIEGDAAIWQHVTLGAPGLDDSGTGAYPTVRTGALLYAGAVVIGAVEIGEGAIVGANSVVLSDVPAGATVVGAPARVVRGGLTGGTASD